MIGKLRGVLDTLLEGGALIDVNGVGYDVKLTESDFRRLPALGSPITVAVHTHVREDAFDLYAFIDVLDRDLFRFLMEANGVGPKLALGVLASLDGERLLGALQRGDLALLSSVQGIGKKKAERLILELQDKVVKRFAHLVGPARTGKPGVTTIAIEPDWTADLLSALAGLGYREADVRAAAAKVIQAKPAPANLQAALKEALKILSGSVRKGVVGHA